ncbi:hypothetical protein GCM10023317_27050 [Actinopolymorpha pittospori]|uniref:Uncharacterized protein n=1 Tax=Actinopolymorpha pittospori TaxID=648752 RepID=A0A927RGD1_9ACTN|nr:hypothetical protein [Actinopolymorpha pittospori]
MPKLAPTTVAVANTWFTEEHARARAFGAWSASGGVGGMAGAVAGMSSQLACRGSGSL